MSIDPSGADRSLLASSLEEGTALLRTNCCIIIGFRALSDNDARSAKPQTKVTLSQPAAFTVNSHRNMGRNVKE